ncbi:MAG: DUF6491 family protein [Pseudomonadota bacterium]
MTESSTNQSLAGTLVRSLALGAVLVTLTPAVLASPKTVSPASAADATEQLMETAMPVPRITGIEAVSAIRVLGTDRVALRVNKAGDYLLRLEPACPALTYAERIEMSVAQGSVYAGFDSIEADGQACRIQSIYRL